jgi:RNA polymerase sigma-70 factor (ECF subfamily)
MHEDRPGRPDDSALVREVAGGSYDALASLYDRHADAVFAAACRLTSDRGVAEEVVQDTFLALWDRAETFNPAAGSLSAWLHTIARNRTVDRLRAAGRRPQFVAPPTSGAGDDSETQLLERAASSGTIVAGSVAPDSPEAALASKETRASIARALGGMATEERTVIVLAYREGLSQSEIAERLGWPLGR